MLVWSSNENKKHILKRIQRNGNGVDCCRLKYSILPSGVTALSTGRDLLLNEQKETLEDGMLRPVSENHSKAGNFELVLQGFYVFLWRTQVKAGP